MRLKGTFSTELQNFLAVILGVGVGVAGLYISLWDGKMISIPYISEPNGSCTVPGLQNIGNNCFLNVILQALASSSCFLSFLRNVLLFNDLEIGEKDEKMPLTVALKSLLEELSIVQDQKSVLNPRKVMLALSSFASNFNLTRQQDASEAFLHLWSALEEEFSECDTLHNLSLADITAFPSKIYEPNKVGQHECERWKQQFVRPFDGTIGSSLTCESCSSMLSMDFEFFLCLPLSPVLDGNTEVISGCTVVDCLNHFTEVERVENYCCGRCWHASALKYLIGKSEKDEILCIHLQRAFMNEQGEFIKLQGHISFSLLFDLFPFTQVNVGRKTLKDCVQKVRKQQPILLVPQLRHLNIQRGIHMSPHVYNIVCENLSSETLSTKAFCEPSQHPPTDIVGGDYSGGNVAERDVFASNLHGTHAEAGTFRETGLNDKGEAADMIFFSLKKAMHGLFSGNSTWNAICCKLVTSVVQALPNNARIAYFLWSSIMEDLEAVITPSTDD